MLSSFWVYQKYICHLSKLEVWELPSASKYIETAFLQHKTMQEKGDCSLHQLPHLGFHYIVGAGSEEKNTI